MALSQSKPSRQSGASICITVSPYFPAAYITEEPTSVNATLNSIVEFNCVTTRANLFWLVNGTLVVGSANDITHMASPTHDGIEGILYIPASVKYNNTEIVCQALTTNFTREPSEPASLLVQGRFMSPRYLCYSSYYTFDHRKR